MKILHTSDWHLGLEFFGVDPTADQQHMIGEIVRIAREQQAGAVIVAGDIFDRAVVAPDAIALYNDAMRALCLELGLPVVLIAGNHDGAARLSTLSDLLRGAAFDRAKIDERMQSLKIETLDARRPVATSSFRLPQGDYFLAEVWRYGRERLENALKNIFENGDPKMAFVLLIINPHHMRLIALPREEMSKEDVYDMMLAHLARCQTSLEQYFELDLSIKRVVPYDDLYALSRENAARIAH